MCHLIIISFISHCARHGIEYGNDYDEHDKDFNYDRVRENKKTYHNGN